MVDVNGPQGRQDARLGAYPDYTGFIQATKKMGAASRGKRSITILTNVSHRRFSGAWGEC